MLKMHTQERSQNQTEGQEKYDMEDALQCQCMQCMVGEHTAVPPAFATTKNCLDEQQPATLAVKCVGSSEAFPALWL